MQKSSTVDVSVLLSLLEGAKAKGYDTVGIAANHGVAPQLLLQPRARITFKQFASVSLAVMERLNDEHYGLLPKPQSRNAFKHLGRSLIHAHTIGDALRVLVEFSTILDNGLEYQLQHQGKKVKLQLSAASGEGMVNSHGLEHVLISVHRTLCWMADVRIPIRSVSLAYPAPEYAAEYRYFFYGAPATFETAATFLEFDSTIEQLPNVKNLEQLRRFLRDSPLTLISQTVANNTLSEQVRSWQHQHLISHNSAATIELAADHFTRHPQSLRRALRKEGVTYEELKEFAKGFIKSQMAQ